MGESLHVRVVSGSIARGDEDIQMPPDRIRRRVPEDLLGAAIEMDDPLRLVDRDDRVGRDAEDTGELRFRGTKRIFDAAARTQA